MLVFGSSWPEFDWYDTPGLESLSKMSSSNETIKYKPPPVKMGIRWESASSCLPPNTE